MSFLKQSLDNIKVWINEKIALGLPDNVEQSEENVKRDFDSSQYVDEEDTIFMPEDQARDYVKRLIAERKSSQLPEEMHIPQDSAGYDKIQQDNTSGDSTGNDTGSWLIY